jgi:hypothetical protein
MNRLLQAVLPHQLLLLLQVLLLLTAALLLPAAPAPQLAIPPSQT